MDANSLLLIVVGLVGGWALGYTQAWRFARKLERHDVVLADWDQPFDAGAPKTPGNNLFSMERQSNR